MAERLTVAELCEAMRRARAEAVALAEAGRLTEAAERLRTATDAARFRIAEARTYWHMAEAVARTHGGWLAEADADQLAEAVAEADRVRIDWVCEAIRGAAVPNG